MLDIKLIRDETGFVKERLKSRNEDDSVIDELLSLDKIRLDLIHKSDSLKEKRNTVSDEIAVMKRNKQNAEDKIAEMKKVSDEIKTLDDELKKYDEEIDLKLRYIPNLPDKSVPLGNSEKDNVEVGIKGEIKKFDFKPKDHIELGKFLDILDFERGAKISGSGFPLYKGKGAQLERALWNFMLDEQQKNGYREVLTPVLVTRTSMEAAEKIPKFEDDMYHISKDDLFAIPTAEVSILNIHRDEILKQEDLPVKYCGLTNCFRREAGSYGKETKGFLRVHQFNKVELITFCLPENSYHELGNMLKDATGILQKLDLYYRVIELCTADLGFAASKCFDIEVWSHAENKWLETSSVSNCTDFQTRRAMIRYKYLTENKKSRTEYLHALNGSGLATSRLMVALLEANQTKEGFVEIPRALRSYTGFDIIRN